MQRSEYSVTLEVHHVKKVYGHLGNGSVESNHILREFYVTWQSSTSNEDCCKNWIFITVPQMALVRCHTAI
jgi:hypothetical protein